MKQVTVTIAPDNTWRATSPWGVREDCGAPILGFAGDRGVQVRFDCAGTPFAQLNKFAVVQTTGRPAQRVPLPIGEQFSVQVRYGDEDALTEGTVRIQIYGEGSYETYHGPVCEFYVLPSIRATERESVSDSLPALTKTFVTQNNELLPLPGQDMLCGVEGENGNLILRVMLQEDWAPLGCLLECRNTSTGLEDIGGIREGNVLSYTVHGSLMTAGTLSFHLRGTDGEGVRKTRDFTKLRVDGSFDVANALPPLSPSLYDEIMADLGLLEDAFAQLQEELENGAYNQYLHVAYSAYPDGTNFTAQPQQDSAYLGVYSGTSQTPPAAKTQYKWALFKGPQGPQGEQGPKGTDGVSPSAQVFKDAQTGNTYLSVQDASGLTLSEPLNYIPSEEEKEAFRQQARAEGAMTYSNALKGEAEGEPAVCQEIWSGSMLEKASVLGKTEESGTGEKGPENPYTLSGVSPTSLSVFNKSLYNFPALSSVMQVNISGGKLVSSSNSRTCWVGCEPNTTYTLSRSRLIGRMCIGYTTVSPAAGVDVYGTVEASFSRSATITPGDGGKYLVIYYYNGGQDSAYTEEEVRSCLMLEKGETATAWEPYTHTTYQLTTAQALYDLPDGTADEYEAVSGTEIHRLGVKQLDGTEEWTANFTGQTSDRFTLGLTKVRKAGRCSHFVHASMTGGNPGTFDLVSSDMAAFFLTEKGKFETTEAFKTWLAAEKTAGRPVTVVYEQLDPQLIEQEGESIQAAGQPTYLSASEWHTGWQQSKSRATRAVYTKDLNKVLQALIQGE